MPGRTAQDALRRPYSRTWRAKPEEPKVVNLLARP
jgi:hypothetical protein